MKFSVEELKENCIYLYTIRDLMFNISVLENNHSELCAVAGGKDKWIYNN